ncbi:MAG: ThiF family adenylyltransferase [Alphaproteobacteria bacterium]|nr:ThiF family adenylyltransferase [Alphaproteobacteria bacterium]
MDKFSDSYVRLDNREHMELISYINSYAHLFYESKYDLVCLPTENIGICCRISSHAGSNSLLIQHEPIVIEICGKDIEECDINVYPDRMNFPFNNYPHINFAVGQLPPTLCLTRERFVNWYAEHSFGELIILIRQWFEDALNGNLIKTKEGDFYEPFRTDSLDVVMLKIPVEDSFIERIEKSDSICYTIDSHGNNLYSRECFSDKSLNQDIGVLLFRSCNIICSTWFIKQPKTLGALYKFASDNEFFIDKPKIASYIKNNGQRSKNIFFQFAFVRPTNVLGKGSKVDYLTFCASMEGYITENMESPVYGVEIIDFATPQLANYISNTEIDIANKNILILGCGAIGSKLIYHLYRSGICNLTICDNDYFLSHNVCRHALSRYGLMDPKVKLIKKELDAMFLCNTTQVVAVEDDIMQWLPKANLSNYDIIIDATASASVFRLVDKISLSTSIPIVHFALSDSGNIGHVYVNTSRESILSDYYMHLVHESIDNDDISNWLKRNTKYSLDIVRIGEGCHSNTMRLGDEIVSTHTGIAASVIKGVLSKKCENTAFLSYVNIEYEGQVFTESYHIPVFINLKCSNNNEWQVRIPKSLLNEIQLEAKLAGKKEVGGYLMGNIDVKHKIIYLLHQFKPADSKQKISKLHLGIKGWREEYLRVKSRSSGVIDYIGDWHSHPSGSLDMSVTDILTNYAIKTSEIPSEYGICLIANSHQTKAHLLIPGIDVVVQEI